MITAIELRQWLAGLEDGAMVAIDDGGLSLVVVEASSARQAHEHGAYLEVGGIPEDRDQEHRCRHCGDDLTAQGGFFYCDSGMIDCTARLCSPQCLAHHNQIHHKVQP